MKPIQLFCITFAIALWVNPAQAAHLPTEVQDVFVRPLFLNQVGPTVPGGGGVVLDIQGNIGGSPLPTSVNPGNGATNDQILVRSSFGQAFSSWLLDPNHARLALTEIAGALYPNPTLPRAVIESGDKPFRYKFLLYDLDGADITQDFDNIDQWFGEDEKTAIDVELGKLRAALAASPFDTDLRNLYLEIHHDLLVAEVQSVKKKLVEVGKMRLGLVTVSEFIIDDEIEAYTNIVGQLGAAIETYGEALSAEMEGVDPAYFDLTAPEGIPFGLYTFVKQQPKRNKTPSKYATPGGGTEFVMSNEEAVALNLDPLPNDPNNPEDIILGAGYKDYSTLLELMAHYIRHSTELARLYGLRQGGGDLAKARNIITELQEDIATDYAYLQSLFGEIEFLPSDSSGVRGAMSGVELGLADAVSVRAFLNGEANLLGLDANFLLIVPSSGGNFDSYDILRDGLQGLNKPLTIALEKLDEARFEYENYRYSLDTVVDDLADVENTFENRYLEITGFLPTEDPPYAGVPRNGSELDRTHKTLTNLTIRLVLFRDQMDALERDLQLSNDAVTRAQDIEGDITGAVATYLDEASDAWEDLHVQRGVAAAAQAVADSAYAVSAINPGLDPFGIQATAGLINVGVAVTAGIVNTVAQTATSVISSKREEDLDTAAVNLESSLALSGQQLVVAQATIALAEHRRAVTSLKIEQEGDRMARGQVLAEGAGLIRELRRIDENRVNSELRLRGKFYADPIHLIRAENSILEADAIFRNAQRWTFYALRALEYKWSEGFAHFFGGKPYDIGTIFSMRNAEELEGLLNAMENWDMIRNTQNTQTEVVTISFKDHLLTPNPLDLNRLFLPTGPGDDGMRFDAVTGSVVTQTEMFRRKLARLMDDSGNVSIPFDTTLLENIGARFFRGPNYSIVPPPPGTYRDKIEWIAVNIVATDGTAQADTSGRPASMDYSGQTYFRTRIPPLPDRSMPGNINEGGILDLPGEFTVSTFRRPVSFNFDNVFTMQSTRISNIKTAYNQMSAENISVFNVLSDNVIGFKQTAFKEYSVAATKWQLNLFAGQFDINQIEDIELVIAHRSTDRVSPTP